MNNEFVGVNIPEQRARALVAEIIRDAIQSLAKCYARERQGKPFSERMKNEDEGFFRSRDYQEYADAIELNISGVEIIRKVRRNPWKYYKVTGAAAKENKRYALRAEN